ncbi:MAG: phosphatidate cytidylyltransferase [Paludibacter sp.]|nr:phosphatidate cytidylyltransferase [Paludibacter sp.]
MDIKTLLVRTLSGAVYVALIVCAILINNFIFAAVFSIICVLTTYEFHRLTNKLENVDTMTWTGVLASFLFCAIFSLSYTKFAYVGDLYIMLPLLISYILLVFLVLIVEIFRGKTNPVNNIAYFIFGQIGIVLPFAFLLLIKLGLRTSIYLLALFVIIWVNDTFAYLVGSAFGKHKLIERISPKKSWEGFFGGLVGALIAGFIFSKFETNLNLIKWLFFALIITVFGTFGDLLESLIKRTVGVKDSGNIMPGHGGFLDRLDSVLFAAPAAFIFLFLN